MRWAWLLSLPLLLFADEAEELRRFYGNLRSLSVEAVSPENTTFWLTVAQQRRFRAEWNGHILISDGTTVWSYSRARRQLILSSASAALGSSIEQLFTTLLQEAPLRVLHRSGDTVQVLCPLSEGISSGFREAILTLRRRDWKPLTVEFHGDGGTQRWRIRSFRANPPISAQEFRFQPPPGTEVIDLRR